MNLDNPLYQHHLHTLWGGQFESDFHSFSVCHELNAITTCPITTPKVVVCISQLTPTTNHPNWTKLSYFIEKSPHINLTVPFDNFTRADYLWQENCLECFLQYDGADAYFEVNMALDGRHNAYRFESYRTPQVMPPNQAKRSDLFVAPYRQSYDGLAGFCVRHFVLMGNKHARPTCINPTAILYHDGTPIFYAVCHANPPDFHDKKYWQKFDG